MKEDTAIDLSGYTFILPIPNRPRSFYVYAKGAGIERSITA